MRLLDLDALLAFRAPWPRPVLALGTFDGVHRGHQAVVGRAVEVARALDGTPVAVTFDRLPMSVLAPEGSPGMLTPLEEKVRLLLALSVADVVVLRFDRRLAALEARTFVQQALAGSLQAAAVVVGFNYTFGAGRQGNGQLLAELGQALGFAVHVVPPVRAGEQLVSSTAIRKALLAGDVEGAARLLGRPFVLTGQVVAGDRRGRQLGFPTANLEPPAGILWPADGVYLTRVTVGARDPAEARSGGADGSGFFGLTVIGTKPTFAGQRRLIETHLLDFEGDLYGRPLRVAFWRRQRGVQRFASPEALRARIAADVAEAKALLAQGAYPPVADTASGVL